MTTEPTREAAAKAGEFRGTEAICSIDDSLDDVADALREAERRIRASATNPGIENLDGG